MKFNLKRLVAALAASAVRSGLVVQDMTMTEVHAELKKISDSVK